MATLCKGFFSRSKLGDTGVELALLDHILASPGITRGAAILTTPAGARGCRWGDHDPVLADFEFGFNPTSLKPKRAPITWAHHYSPGTWAAHNADPSVNETLDSLLKRLESAAAARDSIDLNAVFSEFVEIAAPQPTNRPEGVPDKPSTDPISTAAGRMLGRSAELPFTSEDAFRVTVALRFSLMNLTSESCSSTRTTPGLIHWRKPPISVRRYVTAT
jgi:hypothetical protein